MSVAELADPVHLRDHPEEVRDLTGEDRDALAQALAEDLGEDTDRLRAELDMIAKRATPNPARPRAREGVSCSNGGKYPLVQHGNESSEGGPPHPGGLTPVENTAAVAHPGERSWREVFTDHLHPDRARGRDRGQALNRAELAHFLFAEEGLGAGAIAQRLRAGVKDVYEVLEPLVDDDEALSHADLLDQEADPRSAHPIPLEADNDTEGGALYMAGSQAPRDANCLRRHVLECADCEHLHANGETIPSPDGAAGPAANIQGEEPWPHGWARMERPAGCEWPACRTCKTIWVPTRAAAAAIRVEQARAYHAHHGEDAVLRHVVLSPPEEGGDAALDTVADVRSLYDTARELLDRKGALGWVLVLHPWRGTPGDWRESPHLHAIAAFPAGADHRQGGRVCCRHDPDCGDAGPDEPCCDGSCGRWCVAAREQEAREDLQAACGRVGAVGTRGDPEAEREARAALREAKDRLARARACRCDRGWVFHVVEDEDDEEHPGDVPREVLAGAHELEGGRHQGVPVDAGVLDLLMYELDHAGVLVDEDETTTAHTLRWGGAWSYNKLNLTDEMADVASHYTGNEDAHLTCPACTGTNLYPLVDDVERAAEVHRRMDDAQDRAALEARWAIAREVLGVAEDASEPPDRGGSPARSGPPPPGSGPEEDPSPEVWANVAPCEPATYHRA